LIVLSATLALYLENECFLSELVIPKNIHRNNNIVTLSRRQQVMITFGNENNIIVYPLDMIISLARDHHYIFVVQCIQWIASVIGLHQGLIIHIDNLRELASIINKVTKPEAIGLHQASSSASTLQNLKYTN
jgi:hypothetical protein